MMNLRPLCHFQTAAISTSKSLAFGRSKVTTTAIAAPGSGYRVNDLITAGGGTPMIAGSYRVNSVDGLGGVTGLTMITGYYIATASVPSNPVSTTGGTGSGLTLTFTFTADVLPDGCVAARFQADTQIVRWRDDGVAPTSTTGFALAAGATEEYEGIGLPSIRAIQATSGGLLNVTFYGR